MRTKLKTNRLCTCGNTKIIGLTVSLFVASGLIYKSLAIGLNAGFGPSAGYARKFSELSPLNVNNSGILAGGVLATVGTLSVVTNIIFRKN